MESTAAVLNPSDRVVVSFRDESKECTVADHDAVVADFVKRHGAVPRIVVMTGSRTIPAAPPPPPAPSSVTLATAFVPTLATVIPFRAPVTGGAPVDRETQRALDAGSRGYSAEGNARSLADIATAEAAGFAMKPTVYRRGMLLTEGGVEKARASRAQYEAMDTVRDLCDDLGSTIRAEHRHDIIVPGREIVAMPDGSLLARGEKLWLTRELLSTFASRIGAPSAGAYLAACPPDLRALNLTHWLGGCDEPVNIRTRCSANGGREAYAVVSDSYTAIDADRVADIIREAMDDSVKGTLVYDGARTRVEALYQTTCVPEQFVVGEVFRAGVCISTDDTGGGALKVSGVVYQNQCVNLIIIDRAEKSTLSVRHTGNRRVIVYKLRDAIAEALRSIAPFAARWGVQAKRESLEQTREIARTVAGAPVSGDRLMAGIFASLLNGDTKREPLPLPGRGAPVVDRLLRAWESDQSGARGETRAAVANAITKLAHTSADVDDTSRGRLERAAGRLIWDAAPLGWIAPPVT